jgi:CubicO group peptidase (beta-lactamase class C family)
MSRVVLFFTALAIALTGCAESLDFVDYTPDGPDDWRISTPAEQGVDSTFLHTLYGKAANRSKVFSVLVVKNGYLIAERYFNGASEPQKPRLQSVTKSFTSALVGIAVREGCLSSVDQKMMDFFPELADRVRDPRKNRITIRQMLQMRAGYPWEESSDELFDILYGGFRPSLLADIDLAYDPGTDMEYSNLTAHLLGVIVARACQTDLKSFATEYLFHPLGIEPGEWIQDWEGYYNGHADLHLRPRDMAKFGLLYLNEGEFGGVQVVPSEWVRASLQTYSEDAWDNKIGDNYADMGYGYQWWSANASGQRFNFAWGHGGQEIAVVDDLNLVVVITGDPQFGDHGGGSWGHEKAHLNLAADFIASVHRKRTGSD